MRLEVYITSFPSSCRPSHRLNDADSSGAHAPIEPHQWLPGAWTPSLFGLSREWRVYARCVLTHTLTVDLAIAVSLQRPEMRSSSSGGPGSEPDAGSLEYFLSGFPSLQHLTILAGNGGAPVDENARPPGEANPNTASLAMAEPFGVALAAQQLLGLDRPRGATPVPELLAGGARAGGGGTGAYGNGSQASPSGHPRLTSLELRMHPAVWRVLSGSEPDQFLHRLTAVYPTVESLTLHVAAPMPPPASPMAAAAAAAAAGPLPPCARVSVAALSALPALTSLRLAGPILVEGLAELTQLQVGCAVDSESVLSCVAKANLIYLSY